MEIAFWCFSIEIQNNENNSNDDDDDDKIQAFISQPYLATSKAHCWDKNMNNVVPDIPLYIREENAMQTGCYFYCFDCKKFMCLTEY